MKKKSPHREAFTYVISRGEHKRMLVRLTEKPQAAHDREMNRLREHLPRKERAE